MKNNTLKRMLAGAVSAAMIITSMPTGFLAAEDYEITSEDAIEAVSMAGSSSGEINNENSDDRADVEENTEAGTDTSNPVSDVGDNAAEDGADYGAAVSDDDGSAAASSDTDGVQDGGSYDISEEVSDDSSDEAPYTIDEDAADDLDDFDEIEEFIVDEEIESESETDGILFEAEQEEDCPDLAEGDEKTFYADGTVKTATLDGLPDSEALFAGYVNEQFYGETEGSDSGMDDPETISEEAVDLAEVEISDAYKELTDAKSLIVFDKVYKAVQQIANGARPSTVITLSLSDFGIESNSFTAYDLGVGSVGRDGKITDEAAKAMYEQVDIDEQQMRQIMNLILAICPYDLYWFDKVSQYSFGAGSGIGSEPFYIGESPSVLFFTDPEQVFTISLPVSPAYQGENNLTVDTTKTGAASRAAATALKVVKDHRYDNDIQKLEAYRDYITREVTYNHTAAENDNTPYGDPWQMIWVFDEDPKTTVVCEGYSKAFKYLCDKSLFNDQSIQCYLVSGAMRTTGGSSLHMWNLVSIDEHSYLTDVTNSDGIDDSAIGKDGWLFLAGTNQIENEVEYIICGNTANSNGLWVGYTYDDETIGSYNETVLALNSQNYQTNYERTDPFTFVLELQEGVTAVECGEVVNGVFTAETGGAGNPAARYWVRIEKQDGNGNWRYYDNLAETETATAGIEANAPVRVELDTKDLDPGIYRFTGMAGSREYGSRQAEGDPIVLRILEEGSPILPIVPVQKIDFGVEDSDMLPGWWQNVDRWAGVWVENEDYPEGEDLDYEVLDVRVMNADSTQMDPVLSCEQQFENDDPASDDYWWHVKALRGGEGIIQIEYKDENGVIHGWSQGAEQEPAEFHWSVAYDVWSVDVWPAEGSNVGLPGGSIDLKASISHSVYDPKTGKSWEVSDDEIRASAVLRWSVPEQYKDWVSLKYPVTECHPDGDPNADTITVQLAAKPAEWNEAEGFSKEVLIEAAAVKKDNENHVLARSETDLHIEESYLEVWPTQEQIKSDLWVGEVQTIRPELRKYPAENGNGYDVLENVHFRWYYDDRAVIILDESGKPVGNNIEGEADGQGNPVYRDSDKSHGAGRSFTVRKLNNHEQDIHLEVDVEDGGYAGETREIDYSLNECDYSISYQCEQNTIYTDGTREIPLEINDQLKNAGQDQNLYRIVVNAEGFRGGENGDDWVAITDADAFRFADNNLYLNGNALIMRGFDRVRTRAIVCVPDEDGGFQYDPNARPDLIECDEKLEFDVKDPWFECDTIGDAHLFIGERRTLNGFYDGSWIRLFNTDYPDGNWYPYYISEIIDIDYEEDRFDPRPVVGAEGKTIEEDRQVWQLEAQRPGETNVILRLGIYDPESLESAEGPTELGKTDVKVRYWVSGFYARLEVCPETGSDQVLAGRTLPLRMDLHVETQDSDTGEIHQPDTDRYEIRLERAGVDDMYDGEFERKWDAEKDPTPGWSVEKNPETGTWEIRTEPEAPDQRIRIRFVVYDHDDNDPEGESWDICRQELSLEILGGMVALELGEGNSWNSDMLPGQSVGITPVLRKYQTGIDAVENVEPDDLYYRFEWYEARPDDTNGMSDFEILDGDNPANQLTHYPADSADHTVSDRTPFTIKRLTTGDAELTIIACGTDREGREYEYARRKLYVNRIDFPLYYRNALTGTPSQRGDSGYSWFYIDEKDICVWPDLTAFNAWKGNLDSSDQNRLHFTFEAGVSGSNNQIIPVFICNWNDVDKKWEKSDNELNLLGRIDEVGKFDLSAAGETPTDEEIAGRKQILESIRESGHGTIRLRTTITFGEGSDSYVLASADTGIRLCYPDANMDGNDDMTTIVGHPFSYEDGRAILYVEDAQHCGGNSRDDLPGTFYDVRIVDISSSDENVLSPEQVTTGGWNGWRINALSSGTAHILYQYVYADEDPADQGKWKTHGTDLHVDTTVYCVELRSANGDSETASNDYRVFLNGSIEVKPCVVKETYDPDNPKADKDGRIYEYLDSLEYNLIWEYNDWILSVDEENNTVKGLREGETQAKVFAKLTDGTEVGMASAWFHVHSLFADLDLSEKMVFVVPGQAVKSHDLKDMLADCFTVTASVGLIEDDPADLFEFIDGDGQVFAFSEKTDHGNYSRLTVASGDTLEEKLQAGYFDTKVGIWGQSESGVPTWGSLLFRVHTHDHLQKADAVEPNGGTGASVAYWQCGICGGKYADENGTVEVTGDDLAAANAAWNAIDVLTGDGLAEKTAVETAQAAYDLLAADGLETLIPQAARDKLSNAALALGHDEELVNRFNEAMAAVQGTGLAEKEKVEAAQAAYEALKGGTTDLTKLDGAVSAEAAARLKNAVERVDQEAKDAAAAEQREKDDAAAAEQREKDDAAAARQREKDAAAAEQKAKEDAAKAAAAAKFSLNVANGSSVPLQVKKKSGNVMVETIADGDSLTGAVSANTKVVTAGVSGNKVVLKAGKKTGKAQVTVTSAMGGKVVFTVKVQKKAVKTKGVKAARSKITLKKGETVDLGARVNPITSPDKLKYSVRSKKVATVSGKGIVKAKGAGKTAVTIKAGSRKKVVTVVVTN